MSDSTDDGLDNITRNFIFETIEIYFSFKILNDRLLENLMKQIIDGGKLIIIDTEDTRSQVLKMDPEKLKRSFEYVQMDLKSASPLYRAILISESAVSERYENYIYLSTQYGMSKALVFTKTNGDRKNYSELFTEIEVAADSQTPVHNKKSERKVTNEDVEEEFEPQQPVKKKYRQILPTKSQPSPKNVTQGNKKRPQSSSILESPARKVKKKVEVHHPIIYDLTLPEEPYNLYCSFLKSLKKEVNGNYEVLLIDKDTNKLRRLNQVIIS